MRSAKSGTDLSENDFHLHMVRLWCAVRMPTSRHFPCNSVQIGGSGHGLALAAILGILGWGRVALAQEAAPPAAAATATPAATAAAEAPPSQEVSVVGTRIANTAGSAHVIGKKELERFEYDDPRQVLATVPGVYLRGED